VGADGRSDMSELTADLFVSLDATDERAHVGRAPSEKIASLSNVGGREVKGTHARQLVVMHAPGVDRNIGTRRQAAEE